MALLRTSVHPKMHRKEGRQAKRPEELCGGLGITWNNFVPASATNSTWAQKNQVQLLDSFSSAHKLTIKILTYFYKRLRDEKCSIFLF